MSIVSPEFRNHLVETSEGGVLVAKFSYDGAGRRIESLTNYVEGVPQQSTHYYLSGQDQVLETREGSPTTAPESLSPKYQNVWSPRYVDALILRDSYSGGVLQPASRLYYLSDANYNVTALVGKVNGTWQAVERYAYTAYGKAAIYTPDWSSTRASSLYGNATLYTGRELDASTGLYYYRARYYSADLGTFVGRDPIGYGTDTGRFLGYGTMDPFNTTDGIRHEDLNTYRYVCGHPTKAMDPSGLKESANEDGKLGETIIGVIEDADTAKGIVNALIDRTDVGSLSALSDVACDGFKDQISTFAQALNAFSPKTPCGRWYRNAYLTIIAAAQSHEPPV